MSQAVRTCLLDASIFRHAENTTAVWTDQGYKWGGQSRTMPILAGMRRKEPNNDRLRSEVEKLYTVGRLAREGRLRLYWSEEIWEELSGRRASKNPMFPEGRPLTGCEIGLAPSPVMRTRLFPEVLGAGSQLSPKSERIEDFSKHLLKLSSQDIEKNIVDLEPDSQLRFSDFEKSCLRDLKRFKQIRGNSGHHLQDCFHLWTAETNKLDFFLLLDFKFMKFINQQKITSTVKMVTPSELLLELGVTTADPVPTGAAIFPNPRPSFENEA